MLTSTHIFRALALSLCILASASAACKAQTPPPTSAVSTLQTPGSDPQLTLPVDQLKPQQIQGMQGKLADWPQLARYRAEDATLGAPAPGQPRVVFFGDSITDIWGRQPNRGKFFPDKPWINRGIGGQTTPQMLIRFQQDVLALHPQAVIILAGINDIAGNTGPEPLPAIEDNFRSMVTLAKTAHIRVILCSVLPSGGFAWRPGIDPREEEKVLNTWLQSYAGQEHLTYVDYYTPMAAPDGSMRPGLSSDGLHPIDAGYAIMEPLARAAVEKTLQQPRP